MRRSVLAALALFVTSAAAAPAKGLAVLAVNAPSDMQGLAAQLTQQVLDAAQAQGTKVVTPRDLETFLGPKENLALGHCGPAPECLSPLLAGIPAARVVVGTLARDQSHYLVHFWLISLSPPGTLAEVDRAILIASRRLQSDVAAALPALLRGEQEAKGTLTLDSNVPGAEVSLDGEPWGRTPVTRMLKPGKHEVHIAHVGYYPVDRWVTVEAGKTTRDLVRLVAVPGAEAVAVAPPETSAPTAAGGFRVPVAGWVALGVGLAAGTAGAVLAVSAHNNENQLLAGYNPVRDSYQGFRSQAVTGQNQATWANVCFGIAGAGLLTWGVLTWIASSAPAEPRASVGVGVGAHGATVSVAGRF